jgi:hypothetical protein
MDEKQIKEALEMKEIEKGVKDYVKIMESLRKVNLITDDDFQKTYNNFYDIRHRTFKEFIQGYSSFVEEHKHNIPSFPDTLDHLYKYGRLESSFSSKLLHTIHPELPIWDQHVLRHFYPIRDKYILEYLDYNFTVKKGDKETQIRYANSVYEELKTKYKEFLGTEESNEWIKLFDECYPKYKDITPIKKIDFIIWAVGKLEKMKSKKRTRL